MKEYWLQDKKKNRFQFPANQWLSEINNSELNDLINKKDHSGSLVYIEELRFKVVTRINGEKLVLNGWVKLGMNTIFKMNWVLGSKLLKEFKEQINYSLVDIQEYASLLDTWHSVDGIK